MRMSARFALLLASLATTATLPASAAGLTVIRSGVGVTGHPVQLAGKLDSNNNGRPELLIAGRWHVSIVEEDANPRGYRELARLDAPVLGQFESALLVDVPGAPPALLLQWSERFELRDTATWRIKATVDGWLGIPLLGDVDGDSQPEIVASRNSALELFDPATLASRGRVEPGISAGALADISGDARAELISYDGHAYTLTRNGATLSVTEVWSAGLSSTWIPYAVEVDAHAALVLHDGFGFSAQLATFRPTPSLRTLVPADGPSFTPRFADANGDGRSDAILATTGVVRALDITSGATLWQRDTNYQPPYIGSIHALATADLDGDNTAELAWADASYNSGVVAISVPPSGAPRWRSDYNQSQVADWTALRHADGSKAFAYLSFATQAAPGLSTLGLLDGVTLADQGGSNLAWLPGYAGYSQTMLQQRALAALPREGEADALLVAGAEVPTMGGAPLARWLWTFDTRGALQSSRTFTATIDPFRIAAAQVLARPERQLVVAGWLSGTYGTPNQAARVEVIDLASGNPLWQSALLPSYQGGPITKLEIADLNGDGKAEIILAYGQSVTVLTPASGTTPVASYTAETFAWLSRGPGRNAWLATLYSTLNGTQVAFYDGMAPTATKTLPLSDYRFGIALFTQPPTDALLFATTSYTGLTVQRYDNETIVASTWPDSPSGRASLIATDLNGDQRIDIISTDPGFTAWRLDNDYIFRNSFD
jgi:hypothetical protein